MVWCGVVSEANTRRIEGREGRGGEGNDNKGRSWTLQIILDTYSLKQIGQILTAQAGL